MSVICRLPSGGGGKKSLILPDNASVDIYSYDNKLVVKWTKPSNSEVGIAKYNLYWVQSNTKPTSLKQFTNKVEVSASATEQTITNLTNGKTYWVALESVSTEGYENASLRKANSMNAGVPYFVAPDKSSGLTNIWISSDGKTWTTKSIPQYGSYLILFPFVFTANLKFRFFRRYSDDGSKILSTVSNYDFSKPTNVGFNYTGGDSPTNWPSNFYNAKGVSIVSSGTNFYYLLDTTNNIVATSVPQIGGNSSYFFITDASSYCNGKFFVKANVSGAGYIYSEDGKTWKELGGNVKGDFRLMGYINGYYIITNYQKGIYYTKDFSTLVKIADNSTIKNNTVDKSCVFYTNGYLMFFIRGYSIFCFKDPSDFFVINNITGSYISSDEIRHVLACKNGVVAFFTSVSDAHLEYIITSNIKKGSSVPVVRTSFLIGNNFDGFCPNVNVNTINV